MSEAEASDRTEVVSKASPHSVPDTVRAFTDLAQERGLNVFAVIDQQDEARRVGLDLRETTVVIFGNPRTGTAVMDAAPLAALDLPLKIVVWSNGGSTTISYYRPEVIATRHGLPPEAIAPLSAIDKLTDAASK
jgi:uncharacterized protein (DUF302 family)